MNKQKEIEQLLTKQREKLNTYLSKFTMLQKVVRNRHNNFIYDNITQFCRKNKCADVDNSANVLIGINQNLISAQVKNEIKKSISLLYGQESCEVIYKEAESLIARIKKEREKQQDLIKEDLKRTCQWYKNEILYVFYPDQFGVNDKNSPGTFKECAQMLDYLKDLGVTTIYILPFLESPFGDAGFDVSNPKGVRKDLGGVEEFEILAKKARKKGIKIKADLILNHLSDQCEWFQQALQGDEEKINYFVHREEMPECIKYKDPQHGVVVDYKEDDGSISSRRLMFPDSCDNHFRREIINGKDYYFYHTFYDFQPDLNWKNPKVLFEALDIVGFWANKGIDIFRLDAIPFLVDKKGTNGENLPETHAVVRIISLFLKTIAPKSVLQAEACEMPKEILPYFGEEQITKKANNKYLMRTNGVQVAYNFPYMPAIWANILTQDCNHFWEAHNNTPKIPESASWTVFLRVHDELTLEMVSQDTRKLVYDKLIEKGQSFREGLGVSGRMADFLDNDKRKISLAFSILMSMPGMPIIYYGDEIGANNNYSYAQKSENIRKIKNPNIENAYDSRDINRGPISRREICNVANNPRCTRHNIYKNLKKLIKVRKESTCLSRGTISNIDAQNSKVFSYLRKDQRHCVLVLNNLSEYKTTATIKVTDVLKRLLRNKLILIDLITKKPVKFKIKNSELKIELQPYQSFWIGLK